MLLTIVLAVAVPAAFLYVVHWLDLYGSDRPRLVLLCLAWGVVAFLLSFAVNRGITVNLLGMTRAEVGTRTAPFVEEVWKSLILVWLVHKGRLNYVVDGAVYGYASGIGFAAAENFRYLQLYPDNPVALIIGRDFSSALAHGAATGMTGIALGAWFSAHREPGRFKPLLIGLLGAMTLHYAWNNFAYFSPFDVITTHWILVAVGLIGLGAVGATILWGLRRERAALHRSLGLRVGVSGEEEAVVEHLDDIDRLLAPMRTRFGKEKADMAAEVLHLEARLGLAEDVVETAQDAQARSDASAQVAELERTIDAKRREIGAYAMLYVRTIFPDTSWSVWARVAQALAARAPGGKGTLYARRPSTGSPGTGMYPRLAAALPALAAAAPHHHDLAEPVRHALAWLQGNTGATVQHAAQALGHSEERVREIFDHLVERGLVHRTAHGSDNAFRHEAQGGAGKRSVWHPPRRGSRQEPAGGKR